MTKAAFGIGRGRLGSRRAGQCARQPSAATSATRHTTRSSAPSIVLRPKARRTRAATARQRSASEIVAPAPWACGRSRRSLHRTHSPPDPPACRRMPDPSAWPQRRSRARRRCRSTARRCSRPVSRNEPVTSSYTTTWPAPPSAVACEAHFRAQDPHLQERAAGVVPAERRAAVAGARVHAARAHVGEVLGAVTRARRLASQGALHVGWPKVPRSIPVRPGHPVAAGSAVCRRRDLCYPSSPPPDRPAAQPRSCVAHSSRGLGRRPLTAVTRVRIPYALPLICRDFSRQSLRPDPVLQPFCNPNAGVWMARNGPRWP